MEKLDPPTTHPLRTQRHAAMLLARYIRELAAEAQPVLATAEARS